MSNNSPILLHQFLHGYADGHSLIESSTPVPTAITRTMLAQSDLFGGVVPNNFDGFLTAYPLPELSGCAFARTWYAAEMPRPGCVWTHTLLLNLHTISQIPDMGQLLSLFHRPGRNRSGDYSRALTFTPATETEQLFTDLEQLKMPAILNGIYEQSGSVILPAESARQYQNLLLRTWSQQWPELRVNFSFCTATVKLRRLGKHPFDVQVVPHEYVRQTAREEPTAFVLSSVTLPSEPWIERATTDIRRGGRSAFKKFVWKFGRELPAERSSYRAISSLYCDWIAMRRNRTGTGLPRIVESVSVAFPAEDSAIELKSALLGRNGLAIRGPEGEERLFASLLSTRDLRGFSVAQLELEERAREFSEHHPEAARRILRTENLGLEETRAGAVVSGLLQGFSVREIEQLIQSEPRLATICVRRQPEIAFSAWFWRASPEIQRQRYHLVRLLPQQDNVRLITAMMRAGADAVAPQFEHELGNQTGAAVVEAIDQGAIDSRVLPHGWLAVLKNQMEIALKALGDSAQRVATAACVASVLDPESGLALRHGSEPWLKFFAADAPVLSNDDTQLAVFCFRLATQNPDSRSPALAVRAFRVLHIAAWHAAISDADWYQLDRILPHGSWWDYWDRCDRLRRGLLKAFDKFSWPLREFGPLTNDRSLFRYLLQTAKETKPGQRVLDSLRSQWRHENLAFPDDIQEML